MDKKYNKINGTFGENQALLYLKRKKYKILAQNYKTKLGEIDIICQVKKTIVFVEVKMRETCEFGRPCEAVNTHKQNKIKRIAEEYLVRNRLTETPIRFDVVEVLGQEINHIENCF